MSARPPAQGKRELTVACATIAVGGGIALLAGSRTWATVTVTRAAPLGELSVAVDGRSVVPGVAGLAVVALAGVVALLATRGRGRVVLGVVLSITGALLAWQCITGFTELSQSRARTLVAQARTGVVFDAGQRLAVRTTPGWPALALSGAVLVILGGLLVAVRGAHWTSMSSRYDAPGDVAEAPVRADPEDQQTERAKADLAMWQSLERGEDPTAHSDR